MWGQSLGQEDPLEEGMATPSNILAWRIPWREESRGLQSLGLQRVGHNQATNAHTSHYVSTDASALNPFAIDMVKLPKPCAPTN